MSLQSMNFLHANLSYIVTASPPPSVPGVTRAFSNVRVAPSVLQGAKAVDQILNEKCERDEFTGKVIGTGLCYGNKMRIT